jgi:hypothetical protein
MQIKSNGDQQLGLDLCQRAAFGRRLLATQDVYRRLTATTLAEAALVFRAGY